MAWLTSRSDRSPVPPMGQGLAVLASLAGISLILVGALATYLLSLHVAATNNEGKALDARLRATRQDVQQLKLELDVRSRFVEQERWGATLGLRPTEERQFAMSAHQLGAVAAARREQISAQDEKSATAGSGRGYAPAARKELDSLIGDVMR